MVSDAEIRRSAEKLSSYINKYIRLVGTDRRNEVLQLFDSMHRLFPHWVIATCPMMHPDISYVSKNSEPLFGYTTDYFIENSRAEKFFSHVHEQDRSDLHECFEFLRDQMEGIAPGEHHQYRCMLHYRFRKADGNHIYLLDEKASLQLADKSLLYYVLLRDITSERSFNGVKAEFFHHEEVVQKIKEFKPSERKNLSRREAELVGLIRQGLTTKEIAGYLNLSQNTVRNIKSRLFEKFNVGNSIELLNLAS